MRNLGDIFLKNKDFFQQIQIINIDTKPAIIAENKNAINIINQGSASKGEIVRSLLEKLNPKLINEDIVAWLAFSPIKKRGEEIYNQAVKLLALKNFSKIKNNVFIEIPPNFLKGGGH